MTLNLPTFDETRFAGHVEALAATGVRFLTLADLENAPWAQRRLHALNERLAADTPGSERSARPFEAFARGVIAARWYRPDGQIVATRDDEWIGLAGLGYYAETNSAYNMFTGVSAEWRGRGIALALKLLAIRAARGWSAVYIRTNNDSENAPMLAINRRLGYHPEPGYFRIARDLEC